MRLPPARSATAAIFGCRRFRLRKAARIVKAVTPQGELVAIGEARLPHLYHPVSGACERSFILVE